MKNVLKKFNFGILEGISTELVRKLNIESPNWLEDLDMDYRPYEGEDIHDVISKHHEALQEIIEDCNEKDTVFNCRARLFVIWIYQIIITSTIF